MLINIDSNKYKDMTLASLHMGPVSYTHLTLPTIA